MIKLRNLALAGCSLLLLSQCATREDVMDLARQIRAVNQRVEDVRGTTVNKMQRSQASSVNRLDEVGEQVMQLKAVVEEGNVQSSRIRESVKDEVSVLHSNLESMKEEYNAKILRLEEQLAALSQTVERMKQSQLREAEVRAKQAAERAESARNKTVSAAGSSVDKGVVQVLPDRRKSNKSKGQDTASPMDIAPSAGASTSDAATSSESSNTTSNQFDKAMEYFERKQYKEAYRLLDQFAASNPKGDLAAKTLFYMGESLFSQEEYDLAILEYQKVISNYGQSKLAATALMKQGMAFEQLTDIATAKLIYQKLIDEFSGSPESREAVNRLDKLK
ncbi:MAG: tetratricopeptide repeat protein [Desulfobulbaceae bacterium]|nr:tetratricopeptide repeat protein [Desulfobulbaceae bacterium]